MRNDAATNPVTNIYSTERAFAALKQDGTVVTWGSSTYGGDLPSFNLTLENQFTEILVNEELNIRYGDTLTVSSNSEIRI